MHSKVMRDSFSPYIPKSYNLFNFKIFLTRRIVLTLRIVSQLWNLFKMQKSAKYVLQKLDPFSESESLH